MSCDAGTPSSLFGPPRASQPTFLGDSGWEKGNFSLRMHEASVESGLLLLLDGYGIPFYNGGVVETDDESRKTVTASNVQHADLETHYNWAFYSTHEHANGEAYSTLSRTELFQYLTFPQYFLAPKLMLPNDWEDPEGDDIQSLTRRVLQIKLLSSIKYPFSLTGHEYCLRKDVEAIEDYGPNVTLCEMDKSLSEPSFGIEWMILKILEFPGIHSCGSELDVARHIGSILAGFFNIVDCTTLSNTDVTFSTALSCFGSSLRPDFACRLNVSAIRHNKMLPESFRPVVLAGQAQEYIMSDVQGFLPFRASHRHRLAAQLACIVQPTLVLMIIDAMCKWKVAREDNPKKRFRLPDYALIHGIAYNAWGVLIYGFFPRALQISADGTPCAWGFGCTVVSARFTGVFKDTACANRVTLVKTLLFVQRHATRLSHVLRDLTLSDEFSKCDKLLKEWDLLPLTIDDTYA